MSVCAIMLVKDEADIIQPVIEHLLGQVDDIIVADNGSTDGTRQILDEFDKLDIRDDPEVGYWQSRKMSALAREAHTNGHQWVVPVDADEWWYAPGERLGTFLDGIPRDVQVVSAELYNHLPTETDDLSVADPIERIVWRQRQKAPLPKVAARTAPDLTIEAGNHGARYGRAPVFRADGLVIRHFSWRSEQQYLRKIRNGQAAYAQTDLPAAIGAHWRGWDGAPDEAIVEHFRRWFLIEHPEGDDSLIMDPAPR